MLQPNETQSEISSHLFSDPLKKENKDKETDKDKEKEKDKTI